MEISVWLPDSNTEDWVRARMNAARAYRPGGSSVTIVAIGATASALERLAASVRRWAREPAEPNVSQHPAALVRR